MRKLLSLLLVCLATNAFAQTAVDSGRCPWKLPFSITFKAFGKSHSQLWGWDSKNTSFDIKIPPDRNGVIAADSVSFFVIVDTSGGNTSALQISNNELDYQFHTPDGPGGLMIQFIPGVDSIRQIYVKIDTGGTPYVRTSWSRSKAFYIHYLAYNDSEIVCPQIALTTRKLGIIKTYSYTENFGYQIDSEWIATDSVDLSGIFRPTHFSDQTSGVAVTREPEALHVSPLNGKLQCSFRSSPDARILEVYSLIGAKVISANVPPGATEAMLPKLANGFYVLRLGSETQKIYLDE